MKSQATSNKELLRQARSKAVADMCCIISMCIVCGYAFNKLAIYLAGVVS